MIEADRLLYRTSSRMNLFNRLVLVQGLKSWLMEIMEEIEISNIDKVNSKNMQIVDKLSSSIIHYLLHRNHSKEVLE